MGSDGAGDVLAFWRAVELLSPQSVPERSEDCVDVVRAGLSLPWEEGRRAPRATQAFQHDVYLGVYSLDGAYEALGRALREQGEGEEESGDPPRAGESAVAVFTVAEDGRVLLGSQMLSSCAWALSRASAQGLDSRGWLDGFERAARKFAAGFEDRWGLSDDDERGAALEGEGHAVGGVLDHAVLQEMLTFVVGLLQAGGAGVAGESAQAADDGVGLGALIGGAVEVRVRSRLVGRTNRYRVLERDFLNSFIAQDLGRVAAAVGRGDCGRALGEYLSDARESEREGGLPCRDIERDIGLVRRGLAPDLVPLGRWPRAVCDQADLGQQLAVNAIVNGGLRGDLGLGAVVAVNGPPGTGKTTMLRDLLASLVVERAQLLADLEHPREAFRATPITFRVGRQTRTVHRLKSRFTGFEMVLACATNAAAENVSVEIPRADAIAPEWRHLLDRDAFTAVASELLGASGAAGAAGAAGGADQADGEAWGMVAACLGSVSRCNAFATSFWFGPRAAASPASSGGDARAKGVRAEDAQAEGTQAEGARADDGATPAGLRLMLKNHRARPEDWRDAVADFDSALQRATAGREARQEYSVLLDERGALQVDVDRHVAGLGDAAGSLQRAQSELAHCQQEIARYERELKRCVAEQARHREVRPRALEVVFRRRATREWRERDGKLTDSAAAAERALIDANEPGVDAERAVAQSRTQLERHTVGEREAREHLAQLQERIAAAREGWETRFPGTVFPDEEWEEPSARERRELRAPWIDEEWDTARSELFLAALRLHKAFVLATAGKLQQSLGVAIDVITDSSRAEIPPDAALAAWQCLFLLVPLISTTFASYPRLFRHVEREQLGWLLIDEAGQSTPQSAAGPIWRSQNVVVVGDPLQLEPIVTLPLSAQRDLSRAHGVAEELLPGHSSVQTLADALMRVGAYRGSEGDVWVGLPLNVHRRCEEPMFQIVNALAYDNRMINHTPARPTLALPESAWLHVAAERSQGHWIAEEGERLDQLLDELQADHLDPAQVFVIAPFRDVANKLSRYRTSHPGITAGTIHTAQGKEAEIVILVLGGDPRRSGDKRWAAAKPNLLNVAVSRAKRRLYVIGNHDSWSTHQHFDTLAANLPIR
jgi:hypothetical protein